MTEATPNPDEATAQDVPATPETPVVAPEPEPAPVEEPAVDVPPGASPTDPTALATPGTQVVSESDICPVCQEPMGTNVVHNLDRFGQTIVLHSTCYPPTSYPEYVGDQAQEAAPVS